MANNFTTNLPNKQMPKLKSYNFLEITTPTTAKEEMNKLKVQTTAATLFSNFDANFRIMAKGI